jgi:hypothetical protein
VPAKPAGADVIGILKTAAVVVVFGVGAFTLAWPWLKPMAPVPAGWRMVHVPEVGEVPLPDYVDVTVRRPSGQDYENYPLRRAGMARPQRPPVVDRWR